MAYQIVRYQPEFKEGVLKLLTRLWSPSPAVNAACFEWKHERNPYQNEPLLYLALENGRVVGMRGMGGARWEAGDPQGEFDIPCACDLVIDPDHTNRGLISKIMRFAFDDLRSRGTEYVFNLSAGGVTFLNSLAMGWRSIGPLQLVSRKVARETRVEKLRRLLERWPLALDLARSVKNLPLVRGYAQSMALAPAVEAGSPFSLLDRNFRSRRGWRSRRVFLESSPRPEAMAELIRRIGNNGRIRHVRDQRYFAWRFQDPLGVFRFLYWGQSCVEGYLVLETSGSFSNGSRSNVRISDCEATSSQVFFDLIESAIRLGEFEELSTWGQGLPGPARKVLEQSGFQPQNEAERKPQHRPTVLVRVTGEEKNAAEWCLAGHSLLDASCWDVRPIYAL